MDTDVKLSKFGSVVIGDSVIIAVLSKYALNALLAVVFPIALMWIFKIPLGPIEPPRYVNPVGPVISDVVCVSQPDKLTGNAVGEKLRVGLPETYVSV